MSASADAYALNRHVRLYRYLAKNEGWQARDQIMHWTGFPSPKDQPICAYVEFQNAVMRLNRRLASSGNAIVRGAGENYRLGAAQ